jgi:hypothetical protein
MEKKNTILLMVLGIATLVAAAIGTSYAYFTATVSGAGTATSISSATIGVTYTDGSQITATNVLPGWTTTKTITVHNTSGVSITYSINWASVTNTFVDSTASPTTGTHALATEFYYTYKKNSGTASTAVAMPTATGTAVASQTLAAGGTDTYVFTFAFANLGVTQNDNQGKSFAGTFAVAVDNVHQ